MSPGTLYIGIGRAALMLKKLSNMNCCPLAAAPTASTRSTGGLSCMNVVLSVGSVVKFCAKCQLSIVPADVLLNSPLILDGWYLYSAHRSWYPNTLFRLRFRRSRFLC